MSSSAGRGAGSRRCLLLGVALGHRRGDPARGNLRVTVLAQIEPLKLPRKGPAPIAVFISGHVGTADGAVPPQLQRMSVKVNRHGLLQSKGLPTCALPRDPARLDRAGPRTTAATPWSAPGASGPRSSSPTSAPTRPAGGSWSSTAAQGQARPLRPHLHHPALRRPPSSITFAIKHIDQGPYGTELTASLPQALGYWGFVDRIKLTLGANTATGARRSATSTPPARRPKGTKTASFPLARRLLLRRRRTARRHREKSCAVKE